MHFYWWKCYYRLSKPTEEDLLLYNIVELTCSRPYEPQQHRHSRRITSTVGSSAREWRCRMGYPTLEVMEKTLQNSTDMIKTLQSEKRDYVRDHYKTRIWALRPKRINDVCYSDTFFSCVVSIHGFKFFQMFSFNYLMHECIKLMKREAEAPTAYKDIVREVGAPNKMLTDNAKVLTSIKWT